MSDTEKYKVRYKNKKFIKERNLLVDGKMFNHCEIKDCVIVVEKGETDLTGCRFENCKLMLGGNAYTVARIIKLFTGKCPLKVLDLDEQLFE
jgi:hypothetical protein